MTGTIEDAAIWLPPKHAASTGIELDAAELTRAIVHARAYAMRSSPPDRDG